MGLPRPNLLHLSQTLSGNRRPNPLPITVPASSGLWSSLEKLEVTDGLQYQPYDPAFPEYGPPKAADLVCCIDVLEHTEPELLNNVLQELSTLVTRAGFFTIHQGPAGKTLSDGRNAHLIQKPTSWWLPRLSQFFEISLLQRHEVFGRGFVVVVEPRRNDEH